MKERERRAKDNEEVNGQGGNRGAPAPHGGCYVFVLLWRVEGGN